MEIGEKHPSVFLARIGWIQGGYGAGWSLVLRSFFLLYLPGMIVPHVGDR